MFSPENLALAFRMVVVSRDIAGTQLYPSEEQVPNDIKLFILDKSQKQSRNLLLERSEGTFLWIGFITNELSQRKTCTEALEALHAVPKGLPANYSQMLLKIESSRR
jgi:hypothetical protein